MFPATVRLALHLFLGGLLLAGCSSGSDPKPCTSDSDCPTDQRCGPDGKCQARVPPDGEDGGDDGGQDGQDGHDGQDGQDQGPPPCRRDGDCPPDRVCELATGLCVAGRTCSADYNCNIDLEYCDPDGRVCKTRSALCEPCARDLECPFPNEGDRCIAYPDGSFCGRRCGTLACPAGYVCDLTAGGTAVNPGQCRSNTGSCAGTFICRSDGDCATNKVCNLQTGVCMTKCISDINCPPGQKCHYTGHCGPPCATDQDCGADLICCTPGRGFCDQNSTGKCRPEGCVLHSECLVTTGSSLGYCDQRDHTCKTGCREANFQNVNDCRSGKKCECVRGTVSCDHFDCCPDPGGPCLCDPEVEDCSLVSVCDDGDCIDIPCQERGDVSIACARNQMCCGWPLNDGYTCPSGTPSGQCYTAQEPFCKTCSDHAACDVAGYGYGEKGICLEDSVDSNKYCHPGCRTTQDCPATWSCRYTFVQGCEQASDCSGAATCEVVYRYRDDQGEVQELKACLCGTEADCASDMEGFAPHCEAAQACDQTVDPIACREVRMCHYARACQCANCCSELASGGP